MAQWVIVGMHNHSIPLTVAGVVITAVFDLTNLIFGLTWNMSALGETASHARRAFYIIDLPNEIEEESAVHRMPRSVSSDRLTGDIRFENYSMSYRPHLPTAGRRAAPGRDEAHRGGSDGGCAMTYSVISVAMVPEHLLLAGILVLLLLEVFAEDSRAELPLAVAFLSAAALAAAVLGFDGRSWAPFPGQFDLTPPAAFAKALVLGMTVPVLLFSRDDFGKGPFYPLVLSSLYGVCLLASAESFLTLFLGIELMSIPVYVLVLLGYRRPESAEAALKYLVLSGTASASFLMGASLIYGSTGSLGLGSFALALASPDLLARTAIVMIVSAFFLKAAIVPFHKGEMIRRRVAGVPLVPTPV